jgi:hypothetical protein
MGMKTTVWGLFMTMALLAGCAHGTLASNGEAGERDVRGSARVGQSARAIVAGPALLVHATGDKPVRWFVVDRVSGSDADCATVRATAAPLAESTGVHLTIAPGHLLCAEVARGATDVMWHEVLEPTANMWALR